jgi:hypothetical protein
MNAYTRNFAVFQERVEVSLCHRSLQIFSPEANNREHPRPTQFSPFHGNFVLSSLEQANEEPARVMTQNTALRSIIPKYVMTSLLSLLTSNRRKICVQISTGFWQNKTLSM